ncbi:MAG: DUF4140 domain-containing protein [Myxococcales bacterium]|nr:DUF4140 domain-containing protein [Myxococcales bacterium]
MSIRLASCVLLAVSGWVSLATHEAVAALPRELGHPEDVSLTLYADGQALVRERRQANLSPGRNRVLVARLPARTDTTSIRIEAEGIALVEVLEGSASAAGHQDHQERTTASRAVPSGQMKSEWVLESESAFTGAIAVSYLVPGIQYSASLDLVFDDRGKSELDGWVSIKNQTGLDYNNAEVVLVTVPARVPSHGWSPPQPVERREVALSERLSLAAGQGRRVRVISRRPRLDAARIVVEGGRLRDHDQLLPPRQKLSRADLGTTPVRAELRRRLNVEDLDALALVLPRVTRRIYAKRENDPELLYEDTVDPATMSSEIPLRPVEEVRAERRQLQFTHRKDPPASEETIELVVANDGDRKARVVVVEQLFRSANVEIKASSREMAVREDLGRRVATTTLEIAPGKQMKLLYTVVYRP